VPFNRFAASKIARQHSFSELVFSNIVEFVKYGYVEPLQEYDDPGTAVATLDIEPSLSHYPNIWIGVFDMVVSKFLQS